jgi:hypothetical protein
METVFWYNERCKLVDFLEKGDVQTLNKLRRAFPEKHPKKKCHPST